MAKQNYLNGCIVWEQDLIYENNTLKAQDICLEKTEQSICYFKIHPDEVLETEGLCIGKGCVCMWTLCESLLIGDTNHNITDHFNVCV